LRFKDCLTKFFELKAKVVRYMYCKCNLGVKLIKS
jgi:hypothetical protein